MSAQVKKFLSSFHCARPSRRPTAYFINAKKNYVNVLLPAVKHSLNSFSSACQYLRMDLYRETCNFYLFPAIIVSSFLSNFCPHFSNYTDQKNIYSYVVNHIIRYWFRCVFVLQIYNLFCVYWSMGLITLCLHLAYTPSTNESAYITLKNILHIVKSIAEGRGGLEFIWKDWLFFKSIWTARNAPLIRDPLNILDKNFRVS